MSLGRDTVLGSVESVVSGMVVLGAPLTLPLTLPGTIRPQSRIHTILRIPPNLCRKNGGKPATGSLRPILHLHVFFFL